MTKASLWRRVLRGIWNTITRIRLVLSNLLFLLLLVVIYYVYVGGAPEPLPETAALLLNPVGSIVDEKRPVEPLQALLGEPSPADHEVAVKDVIAAIDYARDDPKINSLVMELDSLVSVGISRTLEIAEALVSFKATGKPVVAVADFYTQDQYLLASYADEVISHPLGGVALEGYAAYQNYFAEALDKMSVRVHVFRAGEHKSAMEPFMRNDMSPAEKTVTREWLSDIWEQFASKVETNRKLSRGTVQTHVDEFARRMVEQGGDAAIDALNAGLVDQLLSRTATNAYLTGMVGAENEDGLYEAVPFEHYLSRKRPAHLPGHHGDRVAVITAAGNILPGDQPPGMIGGDSLARLIRNTAAEHGVKAIVLRINSGGGSMFASEIIRQQVLEAKAAGMPVVVSMGAVAASGGYYIAVDADEIWATPATITGSIGVFAAFPTFEGLMQRAGIHTDGVATSSLAGSLRLDRPLSPELAVALDAGIDNAYSLFLKVVSEGRAMPLEEVAPVAEGRVWSAVDALESGLVDYLGSLEQAIEAAAARADLDDYEVQYIEQPLSPSEQFFQQLSERVSLPGWVVRPGPVAALEQLARPFYEAASEVANLQDPRHIYMRCLPCAALY